MAVNNGNSQNLPKDWMETSVSASTRFSHETDSAENVVSIIREGIKDIGNGSLGKGLYASIYSGRPMELDVGYMIVFQASNKLNGFVVSTWDYTYGNIEGCGEKTKVHAKYESYLNCSDFYTAPGITEYVFHSSSKIDIEYIKNIKTGEKYTKEVFLEKFG